MYEIPHYKVCFKYLLQGFCGYTLTVNDRFLLQANPTIGVLYYRGKYFAFSSREAADNFASNPEGLVSILKLFPQLIFTAIAYTIW